MSDENDEVVENLETPVAKEPESNPKDQAQSSAPEPPPAQPQASTQKTTDKLAEIRQKLREVNNQLLVDPLDRDVLKEKAKLDEQVLDLLDENKRDNAQTRQVASEEQERQAFWRKWAGGNADYDKQQAMALHEKIVDGLEKKYPSATAAELRLAAWQEFNNQLPTLKPKSGKPAPTTTPGGGRVSPGTAGTRPPMPTKDYDQEAEEEFEKSMPADWVKSIVE